MNDERIGDWKSDKRLSYTRKLCVWNFPGLHSWTLIVQDTSSTAPNEKSLKKFHLLVFKHAEKEQDDFGKKIAVTKKNTEQND